MIRAAGRCMLPPSPPHGGTEYVGDHLGIGTGDPRGACAADTPNPDDERTSPSTWCQCGMVTVYRVCSTRSLFLGVSLLFFF